MVPDPMILGPLTEVPGSIYRTIRAIRVIRGLFEGGLSQGYRGYYIYIYIYILAPEHSVPETRCLCSNRMNLW